MHERFDQLERFTFFAIDQLSWEECMALLEMTVKETKLMNYLTSIMELIDSEHFHYDSVLRSGLIHAFKRCDLSHRLN